MANIFSNLSLSYQSVVFSSLFGLFISIDSSVDSSELSVSIDLSELFIFIDSLVDLSFFFILILYFLFFNTLASFCISGIRINSFLSQITL